MPRPDTGTGDPPANREPTPAEWADVFRQVLFDPRFDASDVPDIVRNEITREVSGASTARLALMTADAPFSSLLAGGRLTGTVRLHLRGDSNEWTELPYEILRVAPDGDRFVLHVKGLPETCDPLSFLVGNVRLAPTGSAPLFEDRVRLPWSWQPKSAGGGLAPPPTPAPAAPSPSRREVRQAAGHAKFHAAFDDDGEDEGVADEGGGDDRPEVRPKRHVDGAGTRIVESLAVQFVDEDEGRPVWRLEIEGAVEAGRECEAIVAEVHWRLDDSQTRTETHVVRLERNPDWARDTTLRRGTVDLELPRNVAPGDARVVLRQATESDLPRHPESLFCDATDLMPLPLIVEGGAPVFRVRFKDERAALAAAGRVALLSVGGSFRTEVAP